MTVLWSYLLLIDFDAARGASAIREASVTCMRSSDHRASEGGKEHQKAQRSAPREEGSNESAASGALAGNKHA